MVIVFDLAYLYYLACWWDGLYCCVWLWIEILLCCYCHWFLRIDYWILIIEIIYWILSFDYSTWVVTALAFWCQSCSGCSRVDLNRLYLDDMFVYSYTCILLLGVSSRVLFWPADKGKGKADNQWAWRSRRLVHVGRWHEDLEVLQCYLLYVLSLDDLCLCRTGWTWISNFVMFWDF